MTSKEYTQSIATYAEGRIRDCLSLVPQVNRLEKVLFEGTADTQDKTYGLNADMANYDEVQICAAMLANNGKYMIPSEIKLSVSEVLNSLSNGVQLDRVAYSGTASSVVGYAIRATFTKTSFTVTMKQAWETWSGTQPVIYKIIGIKYVNPNLYSTDEQMIGYWIDGKPLYQKTVSCGALPNATEKTIPHNIQNINEIVSISGVAIHTNGSTIPFPDITTGSTKRNVRCVVRNGTDILISSESDSGAFTKSYVTIKYTKTTD